MLGKGFVSMKNYYILGNMWYKLAMQKKPKIFVGVSGGVDPSSRAKLATGQVPLAISRGKKVFVGVSGGVDSSVSLALLQKATPKNFSKLFGRPTPKGFRGYDVTGVFLKVWSPDFLPCDWREERRSAMRVCATLGVPFMTLNCEDEYKKEVVDYMIREYSEGRVPNPDIFCNKYVKFGVFLKKAIEMGADYVATGHYARVARIADKRRTDADLRGKEVHQLLEGVDKN